MSTWSTGHPVSSPPPCWGASGRRSWLRLIAGSSSPRAARAGVPELAWRHALLDVLPRRADVGVRRLPEAAGVDEDPAATRALARRHAACRRRTLGRAGWRPRHHRPGGARLRSTLDRPTERLDVEDGNRSADHLP